MLKLLDWAINHWSLVLVGAVILYAALGALWEMLFDGGPIDHDEETWGSN